VANEAISMRFCDKSGNLRGSAENLTKSIFPPLLFNVLDILTNYMITGNNTKLHYQSTKIKYHGKIQVIKVKQFFYIYQKSLRLEIADFAT